VTIDAALDPRAARTVAKVRGALVALLGTGGASSITHQRVAERAGVTRATVYRHWPTTEALVIEALSQVNEPLLHHGELPFEQWLDVQLHDAAVAMTEPIAAQTLATLLTGAIGDPSIRALLDELLARTQDALVQAAGDIDLGDPSELLATMLGPIVFRTIIQRLSVDEEFIARAVRAVLDRVEARTGVPDPS